MHQPHEIFGKFRHITRRQIPGELNSFARGRHIVLTGHDIMPNGRNVMLNLIQHLQPNNP